MGALNHKQYSSESDIQQYDIKLCTFGVPKWDDGDADWTPVSVLKKKKKRSFIVMVMKGRTHWSSWPAQV